MFIIIYKNFLNNIDKIVDTRGCLGGVSGFLQYIDVFCKS